VDRWKNTWNNNEHGMSDMFQDIDSSIASSKAFQRKQMNLALKAARNCDLEKSFFELGQGLHSVQDEVFHQFMTFLEHFFVARSFGHIYGDAFPGKDTAIQAYVESRHYIDEYILHLGYNPFTQY
jgi:hypothetical protein